MLRNEGDRLERVVVCRPGDAYFRPSNLRDYNFNERPDPNETLRQYDRLKSTMEAFGTEVVEVPELAAHPNSVFTRDVCVVTPSGYIRLRMGLPARQGEPEWMAAHLDSMDEPCAGVIEPPGTAEGGDVILMSSVAFVGRSTRTNDAGIAQLSRILDRMGYEVRVAEVQNSLHIGGLMSAVGPERVLCSKTGFPDRFFRDFDTIEVACTEPSHGNVICLGDDEVIANAAENADGIDALEGRGVRVHALDLSEFRKGGGGPSCLILPLERRSSD